MGWLLVLALTQTELRWGGDLQGGAPFVVQDEKDASKLVGFEVEIADELGKRLGLTPRFVQTDWSTLMQGLERGTYDIAMNGLEATPARREIALLTRPYLHFDLVLSVRRTQEDKPVRTVGVLENSLAHEEVSAHKDWEAKLYQGVEEPYADLERGRIDAVLMDSVIEPIYGRREGLVVSQKVGSGTYVIACKKTNAGLCERVDAALAAMIDDGSLATILGRWNLGGSNTERIAGEPKRSFSWQQLLLFVRASGMTLLVSLLAMVLAMTWGLLLASARAFGPKWARLLGSAIVESFRGTPVLLQLYVIYFGLAPVLTLSPLTAAIITLGLNYGAYEAEIYRAGLNAVPARQWDAGLVLGLTRTQTFTHIVMPQAIRIALPGMANDFVSLLKDSALVSVITVVELTKQMQITAIDLRSWVAPGIVCAAMYMAMSLPASQLGRYLERRLQSA